MLSQNPKSYTFSSSARLVTRCHFTPCPPSLPPPPPPPMPSHPSGSSSGSRILRTTQRPLTGHPFLQSAVGAAPHSSCPCSPRRRSRRHTTPSATSARRSAHLALSFVV